MTAQNGDLKAEIKRMFYHKISLNVTINFIAEIGPTFKPSASWTILRIKYFPKLPFHFLNTYKKKN